MPEQPNVAIASVPLIQHMQIDGTIDWSHLSTEPELAGPQIRGITFSIATPFRTGTFYQSGSIFVSDGTAYCGDMAGEAKVTLLSPSINPRK